MHASVKKFQLFFLIGMVLFLASCIRNFPDISYPYLLVLDSISGNLSVQNLPAPTSLIYPGGPYSFSNEVSLAALTPTVVGTGISYSVSPALPTGLSIDPSTGVLSGTPTGVSPASNYTVTASNSGGSTTFILNISVIPVLVFSENWEAHTVGLFPGAPWLDDRIDANRDFISVINFGGSKVLSLGQNLSGAWDGYYDGTSVNLGSLRPSHISFRVYRGNSNVAAFHFMDSIGTLIFGVTHQYVWGTDTLEPVTGSACSPGILANAAWFLVELNNINFTLNTYDYYINGVLICSNLTFLNPAANITSFRIGVDWSNVVQTYIDDINIWQ